MTEVLILISMVAAMAVFVWRPEWGLLATVALLPLQRLGSFPFNPATGHPVLRPAQLAGYALLAALTLRWLWRHERLKPVPGFRWLLALLGWAAVAPLTLWYGPLWVEYIAAVMTIGVFAAIAYQASRTKPERIISALLISAGAVCLFGIYQYLGDLAGLPSHLTGLIPGYSKAVFGFPRLQSTALEPLFYANYLLLPLMVGFSLLLRRKTTKLVLTTLPLVVLNFILTTSRGAFLAGFAGLGVLIWASRKDIKVSREWVLTGSGLLAAALALMLVASQIAYHNPLRGIKTILKQSTVGLSSSASFNERAASQGLALRIFSEQPLVGHGIGGFIYRLTGYPAVPLSTQAASNNELLELLVEVGAVGLLLVLLFLRELFLKGWRLRGSPYILGLLAASMAQWVQLLTFSGFYIIWIWVTLGLLAGAISKEKAGSSHKRLEAGT